MSPYSHVIKGALALNWQTALTGTIVGIAAMPYSSSCVSPIAYPIIGYLGGTIAGVVLGGTKGLANWGFNKKPTYDSFDIKMGIFNIFALFPFIIYNANYSSDKDCSLPQENFEKCNQRLNECTELGKSFKQSSEQCFQRLERMGTRCAEELGELKELYDYKTQELDKCLQEVGTIKTQSNTLLDVIKMFAEPRNENVQPQRLAIQSD